MSRRAFGDLIGVSEAKVQALEIGKQRADHETLANIIKSLGLDANWLFAETSDLEGKDFPTVTQGNFVPIPRLDVEASAGHGSLVQSEEGTGSYAFNRKWLARRGLKPDDLAIISVAGDSMEPDLYDGDLILINRADQALRDGRIYAVRYSDQLFVKGVQLFPGKRIFLNSRNSNYAPIIIDQDGTDDVEIIGRVVASMHEW